MSYNDTSIQHTKLSFRDLDIQALQSIWGAESNPEQAEWPPQNQFQV